jgi:hypothetical protein
VSATTKPLNELQIGDVVAGIVPADDPRDRSKPVTFTRPFRVTDLTTHKGRTVMVFAEGGRFWPCTHPVQRLAVLA